MAGNDLSRDLVLAPGEFAFVQDTTKGGINVNVGPYKTSMAGTDQPVIWDKEKLKFSRVDLDKAIQRHAVAPEGFYLALYNPAADEKNDMPRVGTSTTQADLNVGHRINIPGPANRPLWPGQMVDVIRGHHLRSNQYLIAQVYNDAAATANWKDAVVRPTDGTAAAPVPPRTFTPGQLMVIKGTDVAFFIPPTGIKVLLDEHDQFVREAVTLERLEYCILLDEDGNKRFVKGPDVVFPEPTEAFIERDGERKFRAIELNETSGIYIKVIADYVEDGVTHRAGDELFITGNEQAIYYQREEHSVIRYGGQTKHYAVAVPAGEGRYVLNRKMGEIALVVGPTMLLADPRTEVIVRRVLSAKEVGLFYPGNATAVKVNKDLEAVSAALALNVSASNSAYEPGRPVASNAYLGTASAIEAQYDSSVGGDVSSTVTYSASTGGTPTQGSTTVRPTAALRSRQIAGDIFERGTKFTPPRTLTLDTKYEGAVAINVWPGYAVMVIDKRGKRRVVTGPETILLQYDETLAPISLSSGTPKSADKRVETVYLRVNNNAVSDALTVETQDLVKVSLRVAYRVNFEGENRERWFAVEDYVGLLCDHARSLIRNVVKRKGIEEFYANAIDIVRDALLGVLPTTGARPGRTFAENGMRIYDLEVLDVTIADSAVATYLVEAQRAAIESAIRIVTAERELDVARRADAVARERALLAAETAEIRHEAERREVASTLATELAQAQRKGALEEAVLSLREGLQDRFDALHRAELARTKEAEDQRLALKERDQALAIALQAAETAQVKDRALALTPELTTALTTFADESLMERAADALAPLSAMSGVSATDILAKLFAGTPFAPALAALGTRSRVPIGARED